MSFPWNIIGAPKVESHLPIDRLENITLEHISTRVVQVTPSGCAAGASVWGTRVSGGDVYLVFDWQEMREGVALLTDPNGILSNLCFVTATGEDETPLRHIIAMARLLHVTPWQEIAVSEADKHRITLFGRARSNPQHRPSANIPVHDDEHMLKAA